MSLDRPPIHLDRFRETFHRDRKALVRNHGPDAFDQGQVLYVCRRTGRHVVIRDAFYGTAPAGPIDAFIERLNRGWWAGRRTFTGDEANDLDLRPVAGLYAHYLAEVGFDYSVEFAADFEASGDNGPTNAWRMDARGKVQRLTLADDEGVFRDQTGTFFDPRAGWRWLVERFEATGRMAAAEVQGGYVIGVRAGVPGDGDPEAREDPALAEVLAEWGAGRFDTLEFLGSAEAARYPFVGERYPEWLGLKSALVDRGALDLFVLADASEFLAAIEDQCKHHGVAVEWVDPEDDIKVALHLGPLRVEMAFSYPYLRTLHTGRSFVEGARAFYRPMVEALEEAHDWWRLAQKAIEGYDLSIERGVVLVVSEPGSDVPVGRWPLLDLVGRGDAHGEARTAALLELLGYDRESKRFIERPDDLEHCPLCGADARVGKVIRPAALLGVDPRTLAGVEIGSHIVYYTLECPRHVTPIEPTPGRGLAELEAAYRRGLVHARTELLVAEMVEEAGGALLLVGHDVGSMMLEPARIRAALDALGQPSSGERNAYAFFADALVIADKGLEPAALRRARLAALEAVQPRFPNRTWPLDAARPVRLDVPPAGRVERAR
jgi:hypothetical protein